VLVTAIEESPEIAVGEGSVVTARFLTREVHEIARVEILGPDGQRDRIEGTSIHPIWSEDRQDWIPLGELRSGEILRAAIGDAVVQTVELLSQAVPVYNIEVHGEHVYEVKHLGVMVHNSYAPRGLPSQLNVSGKQFGQKMAQRARELGLDPSSPKVRHQFQTRIERIFKNADEVRSGPFRGQGPNGTIGGDNRFFRRGNDVVVTDANGNFITLLTNGINNGFFKGGVPLP